MKRSNLIDAWARQVLMVQGKRGLMCLSAVQIPLLAAGFVEREELPFRSDVRWEAR